MKVSIIALFLLIGLVFGQVTSCPASASALAPWYCSQINQAVYQTWAEWEPIAVAAALVSFMVAMIIFVIGTATSNNRIKSFGMGEIYEAIATIIIVAAFSFIAAELFGVLPSAVAGPIDPYNGALTYLAKNINETATLVKALFGTYVIASYYASISLDYVLAGESVSIVKNVYMVYAAAVSIFFLLPVDSIISIILEGLLLLYVEFYLVLFAMYASIPIFFIPGIILRAILPTRNVGGMLMAIGIGFYLIMPTLFAVAYYFTTSGALASLYSQTQAIEANSQGTGVITNAISPTSPLVLDLKGIETGMGAYWMAVLFFPSLIIAITYESIMIIGEFIGGFSKKSGLLRAV